MERENRHVHGGSGRTTGRKRGVDRQERVLVRARIHYYYQVDKTHPCKQAEEHVEQLVYPVDPEALYLFHFAFIVLSVALHLILIVTIHLCTGRHVAEDLPEVASDERFHIALHGEYTSLIRWLHSLGLELAEFGFNEHSGIS